MPCGASFSDRLERLPGTSEFDWPGRRHPASGRKPGAGRHQSAGGLAGTAGGAGNPAGEDQAESARRHRKFALSAGNAIPLSAAETRVAFRHA